jgi:hypothetical protein
MKSATLGQFHELISKLLTGTNHNSINFDAIQSLLASPQLAALRFAEFVNSSYWVSNITLVVGERGEKRTYVPTRLQKQDVLRFSTRDRTMAVDRKLLKQNQQVLFIYGGGMSDDKIETSLDTKEEVLKASFFLANFHGLSVKYLPTPDLVEEMVCVKLQ